MESFLPYLTEGSPALSYLIALIGGILLSFTPCVYPLVPIVLAVIGSVEESSRKHNLYLSCIYVVGMALTFAALGALAAATGALFGEIQTSPAANLIMGNIILLFALSTLGVINIPSFNLKKLGAGKIVKGKGVFPVFIMGLASGFIGAPCVAPVIGTLLVFIAATGKIVYGFTLLFVFALGLGTLLILVGVFTGFLKRLPGASAAMPVIQKILAAGMILLAQYFIFSAGRYAGF